MLKLACVMFVFAVFLLFSGCPKKQPSSDGQLENQQREVSDVPHDIAGDLGETVDHEFSEFDDTDDVEGEQDAGDSSSDNEIDSKSE